MPGLREIISEWDLALLRLLHRGHEDHWVAIFRFLSDTTSVLSYGVPAFLLLTGLLRGWQSLWKRALMCLLIVLAADYSALFLKHYFGRVRPFERFQDLIALSDAGNASFPSGHTVQASAMAIALALFFPRKTVIVTVLTWAFSVGLARVCLGVHYPSDVLGGFLLSAFVSFPVYFAFRAMKPEGVRWLHKKQEPR